jgi:hypothetical protein
MIFKNIKQTFIFGEFIHIYVHECILNLHEFIIMNLKVNILLEICYFLPEKYYMKNKSLLPEKCVFLYITVKQQPF